MKLKLPDMTKWKAKLPSRIDCERLLIHGGFLLQIVAIGVGKCRQV